MQTAAMTPEVINACALIFGPEFDKMLNRMTGFRPLDLKTAFRKRALETHPDRALTLGKDPSIMTERFKRITLAYSELNAFIKKNKLIPKVNLHQARTHKNNDAFYIPRRKLLIGQFLYYNKRISWDDNIKAIVWQRSRRPRIGRIAIQKGLLKNQTIKKVLSLRKKGERFGECAVRLGVLEPREVERLVNQQTVLQPKIGEYFISKGYLSSGELVQMITELRRHNAFHQSSA